MVDSNNLTVLEGNSLDEEAKLEYLEKQMYIYLNLSLNNIKKPFPTSDNCNGQYI